MILHEKHAIYTLSVKVLLGALVVALGSRCTNICHGAEVHDVIPEAWLSGDGCMARGDISSKPGALIFPSRGGSASRAVEFPIHNFLGSRNRIPTKRVSFSFAAVGYPNEIEIGVERKAKTSRDLHLSVDVANVNAIRELGWEAFRQLQKEFATYLLKKSGLAYPFSKPADRFNDFDTHLLEFWSKCLKDATFKDFRRSHLVPLKKRLPDQAAHKMGMIPLQAGMRLVIHWGGVANYTFGSGGGTAAKSFERQTSSGTTAVEITRRGEVLSLGPLAGLRLTGIAAYQAGTTTTMKGLPFGIGDAGNFEGKIVPVFNEHDLRFVSTAALATKHLALLIPSEYTKTDFGKKGATGAPDGALPHTHDAISVGLGDTVSGDMVKAGLARRFMLWGQTSSIPDDFSPNFAEAQTWPAPALAFGNQSWVDVECGISLNSNSLEWVAFGTTLVDVLEAHARWTLDSEPSSDSSYCLVRLKRATVKPDRDGAYSVHEYLFWGVPAREAASIELHPGDALNIKP